MDPETGVAFSADGLYFREWRDDDTDSMVRLFDTDEMNRWTPLPSPFTREVAAQYVIRAHQARERDGTLQLAVCNARDGRPVGEVIMFPAEDRGTVELAYAVSAEHRGRNVGARAVGAVLDLARLAGAHRAVLTIANDNIPSQATASAAGFVKTGAEPRQRERKGFVLQMETWELHL